MRRFVSRSLGLAMSVIVLAPSMALAQTAPPVSSAPAQIAPPPDQSQPAQEYWHAKRAAMMQKWQAKFNAANTTHDGHLTLAQAKAAGLKPVMNNFKEIDANNRGFVTFNDIVAWHMDKRAERLEAKAAQLRATD